MSTDKTLEILSESQKINDDYAKIVSNPQMLNNHISDVKFKESLKESKVESVILNGNECGSLEIELENGGVLTVSSSTIFDTPYFVFKKS